MLVCSEEVARGLLVLVVCLPPVDIASIRELRAGRSTELMQQAAADIPEENCFTLIYGPKYSHLNLVTPKAEQRNAWMHALEALSKINSECACTCVCVCVCVCAYLPLHEAFVIAKLQ